MPNAVRQAVGRDPLLTLLSVRPIYPGVSSPPGVVSPVFCQRHQSILAPLDEEVIRVLGALRRFDNTLSTPLDVWGDDFELASGPLLEAWVLKTLFGVLAAQLSSEPGNRCSTWRPEAEIVLLNVLFNHQAWPAEWGLWLTGPGQALTAAVDPVIGTFICDNRTWGAAAELGPFPLQLLLGAPAGPGAVYRPGGLVLLDEQVDVQTMLIIGWPDGAGGPPAVSKRLLTSGASRSGGNAR